MKTELVERLDRMEKKSTLAVAAGFCKPRPGGQSQKGQRRASMAGGSDDGATRDVSRRGLFRRVGAAGVAAIAGTPLAPAAAAARDLGAQDHAAPARPAVQLEALETLTA